MNPMEDQTTNQTTKQTQTRGRKKGETVTVTPLGEQTFAHQLNRLEKLLRNCGDSDRQKLLIDTLYKVYQ